MRFAALSLSLVSVFAGSALAQTPVVTEIANIYSWTLPGMPNYGTARGSIFALFGTNLSSASAPLQSGPLQTTLDGVTLNVTVNGVTTQALLYYLSPTQINAVLPSSTPTGTGTLTVTNNGVVSAPFTITAVESDFGLLTVNSGSGPVAGFDASNNGAYLGFTTAANPGDVLELWGTGLGPVANDATGGPVSDPITVYIGGVAATVQYQGRSSYTGLDQINVVVPPNVSGCYVSVAVQTGNYISNFGAIPVASTGRTCADASSPLTSAILSAIGQSANFNIGIAALSEVTTPPTVDGGVIVSSGGTVDSASAAFLRITPSQFNAGAFASVLGSFTSTGSCVVDSYPATVTSQTPPYTFPFTFLNAGSQIDLTGSNGLVAMPLQTTTVDGLTIDAYSTPSTDISFVPDSGGSFTFTGPGGPDVGPFSATVSTGEPLVWSNISGIANITRSSGVTVTWTGTSSGYIAITGLSFGSVNGSATNFVAGAFACAADASAGSFTVPPAVLLSLPASETIQGTSFSSLSVTSISKPVIFTASGLDLGIAISSAGNKIPVTYQ